MEKECCDNCKYYQWYYNKCDKYDCTIDARSVCNSYVSNKILPDIIIYSTDTIQKVELPVKR